jgi:NAD(P)-dependent dehydrogenase (short-subunit alcohol dehydrogenase family)
VQLNNRSVLITGAAGGIGQALARACAAAGARVIASDRRAEELEALVDELGGEGHLALSCDLTDASAIATLVADARAACGFIDVLFANAGIAGGSDPLTTDDAVWEQAYAVNVLQHVRLTRLLLPDWLERGEGYYVATASAAGLLTQIGSAPYAVSKHACVAYAEWLAVTYGDRGLRVSCLAPMGVATAMLDPGQDGALEETGSRVVRGAGAVLDPGVVADDVLDAMDAERFLILPHPEVGEFFRRKGADYARWIAGMRRLQALTTSGDVPAAGPS